MFANYVNAFWTAHCLFSVGPDGLHDLRTQVHFNAPVDMLDDINAMSDEELMNVNARGAEFRMWCPGHGSHDFENCATVVVEGIFARNIKKGESLAEGGFLGMMIGFGGAVKEQGRKSLHVHWTVHLKNWHETMEKL